MFIEKIMKDNELYLINDELQYLIGNDEEKIIIHILKRLFHEHLVELQVEQILIEVVVEQQVQL
jgi:hypothetical protein